MNLLLDTHALLWSAEAPARLSAKARSELENAANDLFFSAASSWEIAIELSLQKLRLSISLDDFAKLLASKDIFELPVEGAHASKVASMPFHHPDPFDRLLIAQAQVEGLSLASKDDEFDAYGVRRLW